MNSDNWMLKMNGRDDKIVFLLGIMKSHIVFINKKDMHYIYMVSGSNFICQGLSNHRY